MSGGSLLTVAQDRAETALGAALLVPAAVGPVLMAQLVDVLSDDDRRVHDAIARLARRADPVDEQTVIGELGRAGGSDLRLYVHELTQRVPVPANWESYVKDAAEQALRVREVRAANRFLQARSNGESQTEVESARADLRSLLSRAEEGLTRPRPRLEIFDLADVVDDVDAAGEPRWLVQGLWPSDAYGAIGAEDKAGKTWAQFDLAVSQATGTPWFGHFACPSPGPVLLLLGEGGKRNFVRRLVAVCEAKDLKARDLVGSVRAAFTVPLLRDSVDLAAVEAELRANRATLVIIDPLYLAAAGARGADLYEMGQVLGGIQRVCEGSGAALVVVTHWNKTGPGKSFERFTGVGPGAWGRVLASAAVEPMSRRAYRGGSEVELTWNVRGSEIPDVEFSLLRRVWSDDPEDLGSPLHYEVDVTPKGGAGSDTLGANERRVLRCLAEEASQTGPLSPREIAERAGVDKRTVERTIKGLLERGLVDGIAGERGRPGQWWAT